MARNGAFENSEAKRLNDRTVGVLGDRQDEAVVLLRRALVLTRIMVAIVLAAAKPLSSNVGDMMFERSGKLLKKMMHAVRSGGGDKKPKRGDEAQI